LRLRRRLGIVFLQQRLEEHNHQKSEREDQEQTPLRAGLLLRILEFCQWLFSVTARTLDYGIKAAASKGMTPEHAPYRHRRTSQHAVAFNRFRGVLGAGRHITARGR